MIFIIFLAIIGICLTIFLIKSIYLVKQAEIIVLEYLGKYNRMLGPGLHFIIPFVESPRQVIWSFIKEDGRRFYRYSRVLYRIDLREAVYDFPKQNVITKDNVTMEINALLYYQITNPKAAVYEVFNLPEAIEKLTQTTLRNVIGFMDLDETLISRDQINERLRIILDEATDKWGVKVNRVELQEVTPPPDIRHAMEKQMRAERERREIILRSEGKKRATILEAEGMKEAEILQAQGAAKSQVLRAEGQAISRLKIVDAESQAISMVQKSTPDRDPLAYLIAMQYIKTLPELMKGKDDKMIVVPYEMSSFIGSLASVKKIFESVK